MRKLSLMSLLVLATCIGCKSSDMKIAMQSYTFHKVDLVQALDNCQQLGVEYVEVFPGHKLGGRWGDQQFGAAMDAATRQGVLDLAKSKGVRIVGAGVFTSKDPQAWEDFFAFAKDMSMEYITCEPPLDMWDYIESLSDKYGLKVAVHNHPKPSDYWDPDVLLKAIEGRSQNIGSCADVGHWKRCGLDQLECLRKLDGRLISFHFKDITGPETEPAMHDTVWGTGILDVPAMVEIMRSQHFDGYIAIEYEYNWDNSIPEIRSSIDYLKSL